ncbi:hypothetical protein RF11_02494 [Thelohanellus kitauei]|uniref:Uncharacterized protein n=1 Tax=Thelohanellus kitauei TaxID=669202 RepID=A0A0C2MDJ1_THEKT|nr:hypothetical protein RF11_02494 [Thelohanellus kitauei]
MPKIYPNILALISFQHFPPHLRMRFTSLKLFNIIVTSYLPISYDNINYLTQRFKSTPCIEDSISLNAVYPQFTMLRKHNGSIQHKKTVISTQTSPEIPPASI